MDLREVQSGLEQLGFKPGLIDGKYGPKTKAAVEEFQQKYGLVVDGQAGPQTKHALEQALEKPKPGKKEPNKDAINQDVPESSLGQMGTVVPPPNVDELKLLDTSRSIVEIINHCTATPEGKDFTVADVRAWHKDRGWSDIGYHYVVYRDGSIMLGRPVGQIGAHVEGHNTGTIGISYIGGLTADAKKAKDTRTPEQVSSLYWLNKMLARKFKVKKISGHNEYAAKACPSFDVRKDPLGAIV